MDELSFWEGASDLCGDILFIRQIVGRWPSVRFIEASEGFIAQADASRIPVPRELLVDRQNAVVVGTRFVPQFTFEYGIRRIMIGQPDVRADEFSFHQQCKLVHELRISVDVQADGLGVGRWLA